MDVGIYGQLTRRNLARIAEEKGDLRTARRLWEEIVKECPNDEEGDGAITAMKPVAS